MNDIYFYDFNFKLLHILPRTESINYSIYYNKIGNCEIHTPTSAKLLKLITENNVIICQMIETVNVQCMATGFKVSGYELIIFGRTLNHLLKKRVVIPFATVTTDAQTLVRSLITDAYMTDRTVMNLSDGRATDITDSDGVTYVLKKQDNFCLADPVDGDFDVSDYRRDVAHELSECVIEYLDYIDCGHRITADITGGKWIFEIYRGREQSLILSEQNRNCASTEKTVEAQDYISCGFYELTDTDENEQTDTSETKQRASDWIYVPGPEVQMPLLRFEGVLSGSCKSEAEASLKSKRIKRTLTSEIQRLKFGSDYGIGDVFTAAYNFGGVTERARVRVTGVNISIEKSATSVVPELTEIDKEADLVD